MANVAVTCIKNGRSDSFGRPLVSGTYYPSVEIETAKALWNSGYVSVADASVFDQDPLAGTSPLDDFNIARALSLSRQPAQTIANIAAELAAIGVRSPGYGIGVPNTTGFGVGICPETLPAGVFGMSGYTDPASENYGNYQSSDGSVLCWIPAFYMKWGTGTNGLAINVCSIISATDISADEAFAQGYALHRAFINGGQIKSGFFIDKYQCSRSAAGIAVSVKNGAPLSSAAAHNGFSTLSGSPADAFYGAIAAARTRGSKYFPALRFHYDALAKLHYAHASAATSTAYCAYYDPTNNFPKGNNNNALRDANDATVIYTSDGYPNCGLTGSGTPFAKTTHNGQNCGVADLNGNLWEISLGLTSDGTSYYVLKPSVDVTTLTDGNTLATDVWGAAGRAANYDVFASPFGVSDGAGVTRFFGNASQVFSSALSGAGYNTSCLGIPIAGGVGGTNAFGNDGLFDYRPSDMCAISGGSWSYLSDAGVWTLHLGNARSNSTAHVGFRAALYL